ncbi:outer membrane protein assembly factor [Mesorhizobium sp. M4B.F.Ca.ET.215.01.1.1]|uniref:autotransporter assembly complex protein TamA n=1 Tax=unclassified Mesorhizobium TaxID=325217 RepID=UPI000FCA9CA7|nr:MULTISPECIES: autotransporter assembly complex family protein [unclassified Mesorhizobium]RUW20153.1 outer membrane protein assembly factor [Mesorhizobium sp. M4B.F.Ca.ET.013.02.1.1]RVD41378.1 outer membrane protein assembly factor [Mesorhizobium sp. M4B.F.Ca.ET.019.03.1.1]TGQ10970.1 outer membrane protein assembly factor [Mesorhizobium sp. M4B.F.Ca.ET.215.01.1.1]TGQ45023.1 outer membrane protein assembly factor [Mesorhizobium sp. M00.F.Ca.ET.220.01.1.1]TGR04977.1 outer membrane protein ass
MPAHEKQMSGGIAPGRGLPRALLLAALCSAVFIVESRPATAFEFFGIKLWGSASDEDADIVDPLRYSVTIEAPDADKDLVKNLENASTLKADEERPVSGSLGLLAEARADREGLVAALYADARYEGVVTITIEGKPLDDLPPDAEFKGPQPIPVAISIVAGPKFTLGNIRLEGDAAGLASADFGLIAGGDAGSGAVLKAEALIVRALKQEGRPLATITDRQIVAEHATSTLDVTLTVAAGPVAGYGDTTVEGTEKVDRDFTEYMTGLKRGRQYSPDEIDDARDRLLGLEVFNSVTMKEGESLDAEGNIPINVQVSERKPRYFGLGGTVSNTEGLGLEGYWGHRNLFGRAEKLRIEGAISGIGSNDLGELNYNAGIMFEKPGVLGPSSKFFTGVKTVFEHPDAYDHFSVKGNMGVSYDLDKKQRVSAEFALDYSRITDTFGKHTYLIASVPLQYVYDGRDNRLNPTSGFRVLAYAEPSYDLLNGATFLKLKGEGSAYQSLDTASKFVLAERATIGSIVGTGLQNVPADRRFYSGGGGSVRGYAYQGIGPKDIDGQPIGGLSFFETSVEMRIAVTDTIGIVPFVDAGTVSTKSFPDFSGMKVGAGVGVRYLTPFGPLRVDAAVPLNRGPGDPHFGIYAGIGQAF